MRLRPSARLLLVDQKNRILLFRFVFKDGALAGTEFWATPGGALALGETFEDAAKRELFEETGIHADIAHQHIAELEFSLPLPNGEIVMAKERFFVVRTKDNSINRHNQTDDEIKVMADHKWWDIDELSVTMDKVYPENLAEIFRKAIEL